MLLRDHDAWPSLARATNLKKQKIEHEYSNKTYLWYDNRSFYYANNVESLARKRAFVDVHVICCWPTGRPAEDENA